MNKTNTYSTILGGCWREKVVSVFRFGHSKTHFRAPENGHFCPKAFETFRCVLSQFWKSHFLGGLKLFFFEHPQNGINWNWNNRGPPFNFWLHLENWCWLSKVTFPKMQKNIYRTLASNWINLISLWRWMEESNFFWILAASFWTCFLSNRILRVRRSEKSRLFFTSLVAGGCVEEVAFFPLMVLENVQKIKLFYIIK